jgi:wyosine [tRNA(Phe)-imidazoG37] synthetase (radical SAM superfamily)
MLPQALHIEPTNICTLKCAGCARTRFLEQWPQHWRNHSLNIETLMQFLDIDLTGMPVIFCGNYGDPIYHPDFVRMIQEFKQRRAHVKIVTNGSHKKSDWWQELASCLDHNDSVIFSVDGIPENFTQYRANADWSSIQTAMTICAQAKCKTIWKYIPFAFNQHHIDQAKTLSQQLGIDFFDISPSDRFDQQTEHLRPTNNLLGNKYHKQQQWKMHNEPMVVAPKCATGREHFITADGYYSPCCYVADHRFYYKTDFGKNKNRYSIADTSLSSMVSQPTVINFYQSLDSVSACQFNCPKIGQESQEQVPEVPAPAV